MRRDAAGDEIEARVREGQGGGLGELDQDVGKPALGSHAAGGFDHAGRQVGGDHPARRLGHAQGGVAGPAGDVQADVVGPGRGELGDDVEVGAARVRGAGRVGLGLTREVLGGLSIGVAHGRSV